MSPFENNQAPHFAGQSLWPPSGSINRLVFAFLVALLVNFVLAWLMGDWFQIAAESVFAVDETLQFSLTILLFMVISVPCSLAATWPILSVDILWLLDLAKKAQTKVSGLEHTQASLLNEMKSTTPYVNLLSGQLSGAKPTD